MRCYLCNGDGDVADMSGVPVCLSCRRREQVYADITSPEMRAENEATMRALDVPIEHLRGVHLTPHLVPYPGQYLDRDARFPGPPRHPDEIFAMLTREFKGQRVDERVKQAIVDRTTSAKTRPR